MTASPLITTAEAAFIAGLTDRQMNRVVDEQLMPELLFERQGNVRRFTRLSAAFAKFYFDDTNWLIASARRRVVDELTDRVTQLQHMDAVLALMACIVGLALSGWLYTSDLFWGDARIEAVHLSLAWTLVALVALHVAGVLFTGRRQRENLVRAMVDGRKRAPTADDVI